MKPFESNAIPSGILKNTPSNILEEGSHIYRDAAAASKGSVPNPKDSLPEKQLENDRAAELEAKTPSIKNLIRRKRQIPKQKKSISNRKK